MPEQVRAAAEAALAHLSARIEKRSQTLSGLELLAEGRRERRERLHATAERLEQSLADMRQERRRALAVLLAMLD
jgi:septal ring factor EnvC (AmiA/AmiB activator)